MNPGYEHLYSKLRTFILDNQKKSIELLKNLIQQKSTQGNESGAQSVLLDYLKTLPLEIDVWDLSRKELATSPYFISDRTDFENCPNLVAILKGSGGGKSLLLNGHIDVVPEGEIEKWTDHPYSAEIREGRMYGRGTTDMKGGSVSLIMALEAIIKCGIVLEGNVIFESVIEEESGGAGTLSASLRGYKADAAIIPEPTGMKLFIKQQGSMWFRIRVPGRSAHGGTRYEGVSAIEKAWLIHEAILNLEKERNARIDDKLYKHIAIPLPINVGLIKGGSWPSSVPDMVVIEGRMGVGPEEKMESARTALRKCIESVSKMDEWLAIHPAELEFFGAQWIPNSVDDSHPVVAVVETNYRRIYNDSMPVEASPWGTDAGILNEVGGTTTLVIGPGETRLAHYPDEYIDLNKMTEAAMLFAFTILDWCGVGEAKSPEIPGVHAHKISDVEDSPHTQAYPPEGPSSLKT